MYEIVRGISNHYEHADAPIPPKVDECLDRMLAQVRKSRTAREKCRAYMIHFWALGEAMGAAAWQEGNDDGVRWSRTIGTRSAT
jgi:hypothetical protein